MAHDWDKLAKLVYLAEKTTGHPRLAKLHNAIWKEIDDTVALNSEVKEEVVKPAAADIRRKFEPTGG